METIKKTYQLSKTLSFGLTLKNHDRKNKTHQYFKYLIDISTQRIIKDATNNNSKIEQELVTDVSCFVQKDISKEILNRYTMRRLNIIQNVNVGDHSKKCPACESTYVRGFNAQVDIIVCYKCNFQRKWDEYTTTKNNKHLQPHKKLTQNIQFIQNGDDKRAYHFVLKTPKNQNRM